MRHPVGFIVWNPSRSLPTMQYATFAKAEAEAGRFRALHPDETFWVMAPVKGEKTAAAAKAFSDGKAEGLAQAHAEIMLAEGRSDRLDDENRRLKREQGALAPIRGQAVAFQAIVADCLCWFDGFNAAHRSADSWERPNTPSRDKIMGLNSALQLLLPGAEADDGEWEIPF